MYSIIPEKQFFSEYNSTLDNFVNSINSMTDIKFKKSDVHIVNNHINRKLNLESLCHTIKSENPSIDKISKIELIVDPVESIIVQNEFNDSIFYYKAIYKDKIEHYINSFKFYFNIYKRLSGKDIKVNFKTKLEFDIRTDSFQLDVLFEHEQLHGSEPFSVAIQAAMRCVPKNIIFGNARRTDKFLPHIVSHKSYQSNSKEFNYNNHRKHIYSSITGINMEPEFFNKIDEHHYESNFLFKAINFYLNPVSEAHGTVYDICDIDFVSNTEKFEEIINLASMSNI
jgi:hypothetical protein